MALWARTEKKTQKKWPSESSLSREQGSEQSERTSERVSAAEGASKASIPEQVNERANGRASGPVLTSQFLFVLNHSASVHLFTHTTHYSTLLAWLVCSTVHIFSLAHLLPNLWENEQLNAVLNYGAKSKKGQLSFPTIVSNTSISFRQGHSLHFNFFQRTRVALNQQ